MSAQTTTPQPEANSPMLGGRDAAMRHLERSDLALAHGLLRLALGVNILMHGLVPIMGGIDAFAAGMVRQFAHTILPPALVGVFGTVLPVIQLVIGALLVVGAFTRAALVVGELVIIGLVFGTSLLPNAGTSVSLQMLYALIYAVLLALAHANVYSVDALRARRRAGEGRSGRERRATAGYARQGAASRSGSCDRPNRCGES